MVKALDATGINTKHLAIAVPVIMLVGSMRRNALASVGKPLRDGNMDISTVLSLINNSRRLN